MRGDAQSIAKFGINEIVSHLEKHPLTEKQIKETQKELNKNAFYILGFEKGKQEALKDVFKLFDELIPLNYQRLIDGKLEEMYFYTEEDIKRLKEQIQKELGNIK